MDNLPFYRSKGRIERGVSTNVRKMGAFLIEPSLDQIHLRFKKHACFQVMVHQPKAVFIGLHAKSGEERQE